MKTQWLTKSSNPESAAKISRILGCHKVIATILVNRGITTPEQAFTFLNPTMANLTDPFALKDMKKAVQRIHTALCNKEKILIFGDFDADGVTATSLLYDFFSHAGAEVSWYIPHRIREGFSLKEQHIEMAVKRKCDLLITVDCGSDSHGAVKAAIKEDIDVIITDHHEVTSQHEITSYIPPALAVINPKRADCNAGLEHLAGVGVALYLVIALRQYLRQKGFWKEIEEPNLMDYCDLFAIGTIADMVPLKAENRILSKAGMGVIQHEKREGIRALTQVSKINPATLGSDDISFRIAPRINAAGRISHAGICVDLLTEKNRGKAEQAAFILDELNKKRQQLEKSIVDDIEERIVLNPDILNHPAIVMHSPHWNPGVLGIAASKLSRKYCRPVILISTAVSPPAGSCRSINNINIHQALYRCKDLLDNFGGHVMAAGITIQKEKIDVFIQRFEAEIAKTAADEDFIKKIHIDSSIDIHDITESFLEEAEHLHPFGNGNPEPLFQCTDLKVISSLMMGSKHRKMVLQQTSTTGIGGNLNIEKKPNIKKNLTIEAVQFNIDPENDLPNYFKRIAFRAGMNRFNKKNTPQIIIEET